MCYLPPAQGVNYSVYFLQSYTEKVYATGNKVVNYNRHLIIIFAVFWVADTCVA